MSPHHAAAIDFFDSVVRPTIAEILNDPLDIRRGRLAAIVLNHMAEVRRKLTATCQDFAVIWDVTDASKHHKLTRQTKQLSSSEQISRPTGEGIFDAPFGEAVFAEALQVRFTAGRRDEPTASGANMRCHYNVGRSHLAGRRLNLSLLALTRLYMAVAQRRDAILVAFDRGMTSVARALGMAVVTP